MKRIKAMNKEFQTGLLKETVDEWDTKQHIIPVEDFFTVPWFMKLKDAIQMRGKIEAYTLKRYRYKQIKQQIDIRCELILINQRKWLKSALDRPEKTIKIDKAIKTDPDNPNVSNTYYRTRSC